jgi:hypothetical protein
MAGIPQPKPCYLDEFQVWKTVDGRKVWRNHDGDRLYTWDALHGEIEVYNKRGRHLGALNATNGEFIKEPVRGRKLNVK